MITRNLRRRFRYTRAGIFAGVVSTVLALVPGCFGDSAEQMLQTAEFEELQRNDEHARRLYERIIDEFPAAPEAEKARERLTALTQEDAEMQR